MDLSKKSKGKNVRKNPLDAALVHELRESDCRARTVPGPNRQPKSRNSA